VRERLTAAGVIVQGGTPEAFGQMMAGELTRWDAVRKAAGFGAAVARVGLRLLRHPEERPEGPRLEGRRPVPRRLRPCCGRLGRASFEARLRRAPQDDGLEYVLAKDNVDPPPSTTAKENHRPMSRLLEIPPEKLTAEQKTVFDQLNRRARAHPRALQGVDPFADGGGRDGAYRDLSHKRSSLTTREGRDRHSRHRAALGRRLCAPGAYQGGARGRPHPANIDAVLAGRDPKLADPHERAVHRFVNRAWSRAGNCRRRNSPRSKKTPRPRRHRGSPRAARLLHLGRHGDEGARVPVPPPA